MKPLFFIWFSVFTFHARAMQHISFDSVKIVKRKGKILKVALTENKNSIGLSMMRCLLVAAFYFIAIPLCSAQEYLQHVYSGYPKIAGGKVEWLDLDNDNDLDVIFTGRQSTKYSTFIYNNNNNTLVVQAHNLPDLLRFVSADYDKDGDIDLLATSADISTYDPAFVRIYNNDGAFNFSPGQTLATQLFLNAKWLDVDADDDLDIFLLLENVPTLYENNGGVFIAVTNTNLPTTCAYCYFDVADTNADGKPDIMFGSSISGLQLYMNNGDKKFSLYNATQFKQGTNTGVAFGDFDRDGDFDLISTGDVSTQEFSLIYENVDNKFIERKDIVVPGVAQASTGMKWFNLNNDGLLDLMMSGAPDVTSPTKQTRVFKNNGNNTFTRISDSYLPYDLQALSSLDPGDYDNDGDTDVGMEGVLSVVTQPDFYSGYYKNLTITTPGTTNTQPQPPSPSTFSESTWGKAIRLKWGDGSDGETPKGGLFYNFYLRNDIKKLIIPDADVNNGYLRTNNSANGMGRAGYAYDMPEGTLYYAVQSIDGAKTGSLFSAEKSFYHFNGPQAVKVEVVSSTQAKVTWNDNSSVETNYDVLRSLTPIDNFNKIATLSANVSTYTDNFSFAVETHYYYRIRGYNAQASLYDSISFLMPAPVSNLVAKTANSSTIKLTWKENSQYETNIIIERRQGANSFATIATLNPNATEYIDTNLGKTTTYDYRVRVINVNWGIDSPIVSATTNAKPTSSNFSFVGDEDNTLTFSAQSLSSHFSDPNPGDKLDRIKIKLLPVSGVLYVYDEKAVVGQEITSDLFNYIEFVPYPDFAGDESLTVTASDGMDYSENDWLITLTINQINDAPLFYQIANELVNEDFGTVSFPLPSQYYYPGEESQTIVYSLSPTESDIVDIQFTPATGEISLNSKQDKFGEVNFTLTANDGQVINNSFSQKIKLTVNPVNDKPIFGLIEDQQGEGDVTIDIILDVVDPDNNTVASMFSAFSQNQKVVKTSGITFRRTDDGKIKMTITPESKGGGTTITVTLNDGSYFVQQTFSVEVKAAVITGLLNEIEEIKIYPNPTSDFINIGNDGGDDLIVTLKDTYGRVVYESKLDRASLSVDVSDLSSGVYIIEITGQDQLVSRRKIVKK